MTPLKLRILVGALGFLGGFITQTTAYVAGIVEKGGAVSEVNPVTIVLFALIAIGAGVSALSAFITKELDNATPTPPTDAPRLDAPDVNL